MPQRQESTSVDLGDFEEGVPTPEVPPHGQSGGADPPTAQVADLAGLQGSAVVLLKMVAKSLEGILPFLILIFSKVMYDHRLGILVFVGLCGTFHHVNAKLHKLAAQRGGQNLLERLESIAWLVVFLSANIFFIFYFFEEQKLYRALYFVCPEVEVMTLWTMLWIAGTTDFVLKFLTVLLKVFIVAMPRPLLAYKKKGKYYMLLEMLSQTYRSLVPIMPWVYFLLDDKHGGQWFSIVLLVVYAICKGYHLLVKGRELRTAFAKFAIDLSYGAAPNRSQLDSCDNSCPICQDKFTDPVMLSCKHIFCEDCVAMWFDRDRTCPMCRATITDSPQWRDGTTWNGLQIY
jgi:hypothetical protein